MNKELDYAELEEEDEMLLMAHMEKREAKRSDAWFLDSGCSNHMCASECMFSSLDQTFSHILKLGINTKQRKNWTGKNIEIDKNTVEGGEIIEETTEPVAETIEPVAENEEEEITEETTESVAENEEGKITEETTESVAETIEPVAENYFLVTVAPDLTIREGRNRHPSVWLTYYNFGEGLFEEDEENMAFLVISDPVNFEEAVKSPK
ncbi:uncharacterized protein LOC111777763 [Cucurbita pepo subsp. pepo]|uniref:uncharacterized protein LOC111777763 n=1 Tax=Cucurbita pepo subsp. pepo TaxID=3664 RepID=UPI000C9D3D73|nr:uncharacterized protein LOC111777763 [Cucurbita pepo subsp. pepo]